MRLLHLGIHRNVAETQGSIWHVDQKGKKTKLAQFIKWHEGAFAESPEESIDTIENKRNKQKTKANQTTTTNNKRVCMHILQSQRQR